MQTQSLRPTNNSLRKKIHHITYILLRSVHRFLHNSPSYATPLTTMLYNALQSAIHPTCMGDVRGM